MNDTGLLFFVRRKNVTYYLTVLCVRVSVCLPFQVLSQLIDFHKIRKENYPINSDPNSVTFNSLQSVKTRWRTW